jgi:predicted ester cyclase
MSTEENKAIFRRFIEEVWNHGNLAVADELFAPNAVSPSAPQLPPGSEFRSAFPDFHMKIEDLIAEGDKVIARLTESGTHLGEFMGIAPTGKHVEFTEIGILRIADSKVIESWYETDMFGLMQQLSPILPIDSSEI